jgi:hypothetical protein
MTKLAIAILVISLVAVCACFGLTLLAFMYHEMMLTLYALTGLVVSILAYIYGAHILVQGMDIKKEVYES